MIPIEDYTNESLDSPEIMIVSIEKELIEKIKKVSTFVHNNNLFCAQMSIPSPDYYTGDEEDREILDYKINSNCLIIKDKDCFFKGFIGHDYVESERFDKEYIEFLFHIKELPIEHMAKYINDDDENIRNIVRERLEGKE